MEKIRGNFVSQPNKDFPLDCETLEYLQELAELAEVVGNIAGDRVILSGCRQGTNMMGPGYVFLRTLDRPDGEVLYWSGGATTSGAYVKQESIGVSANNVEYPRAYTRRSLAPGVGTENYDIREFTRIKDIAGLMEENSKRKAEIAAMEPAPVGCVLMWAGESVPEKYVLCNGQELKIADYGELYEAIGMQFSRAIGANGEVYSTRAGCFRVPDLRGRFVVGQHDSDNDYKSPGQGGGLKMVTLDESTMPKHSHKERLWQQGSGTWKNGGNDSTPNATAVFEAKDTSQTTYDAGAGQAHENRPPYYVMTYIIKVR